MQCKFCHNPDTWGKAGKEISVDQVVEQIREYVPYFKSTGGGITISGGEPLLQADFVAEVFRRCQQEGVNTAIETSGFVSPGGLICALPYIDEVFFSIKIVDEDKHKQLTGFTNRGILNNLKFIVANKGKVTIQYVVIPGTNDSEKDLHALKKLIQSLSGKVSLQFLPYHKMGVFKWELLGMTYGLGDAEEPSKQTMDIVRDYFKNCDCEVS